VLVQVVNSKCHSSCRVCLCCDTVQLLNEEYAALSPDTLENLGFLTSVAKDPGLSDTQKKVFGNGFCLDFYSLKIGFVWFFHDSAVFYTV